MAGTLPALWASGGAAAPVVYSEAFGDIGVFLNGAALHPLPSLSAAAGSAALARQVDRSRTQRASPTRAAIARLINAHEDEIAFVPSTGHAENMVATSVGLGAGVGVVTDMLHFDGSLAMYGARARRGMPLTIVRARNGIVHLDDIAAAMTPQTKLVAVSAISNYNGFRHDLRALCDMVHSHGALVFADIIQLVGAMPFDVATTGIDFCAASSYKWMMGDLGFGFLYVRQSVQDQLSHASVGWNGLSDVNVVDQRTQFEKPISENSWSYEKGARGLFEVGQPSKVAAATVNASIEFLEQIGLERIAKQRDVLRKHARSELIRLPGVIPLTPDGISSSIESFAIENAERRFREPLADARITVGLYPHRLRLSPSLYNSVADIDRLVEVIGRV